jgi:transposase-like protein
VKNNGISSDSPTVLPAAERREDERSETDRSTAAGKTVAPNPPRPNPEVVADAKRRTFTAEYKLRILAEADAAAAQPGGIGALQRREGLYSSHLVTWRRERQAGILKGLTPHKRGPKSKRNPQEEEMQQFRCQNQRLTEELRKAAIVIDVQKKVGALLGWPLPKAGPEEQP